MSEMTVDQLRAAQEAEYGTYIATEPIVVNGVRAFNVGDPVPKSHVERGVVQPEQVAKSSTKAAAKAVAEAAPTAPKE